MIAFDRSVLSGVRILLPDVELGWIVDWPSIKTFDQMIAHAVSDGLHALDFSASWPLDESFVGLAHSQGLKVYVWTVDEPEMARRFAGMGVDGITTNAPARISMALQ